MEIILRSDSYTITPLSPVLEKNKTDVLRSVIMDCSGFKIGINLDYVVDCSYDFIQMLFDIKNLCLFNVSSDMLVLLCNMNLDKKIKLYNSEEDFLAGKHPLLNRNFSVVRNN